ncbi:MAG: methyltransferase domain-containing protein [Saprospiraceae bacterium]|nr:methyltransferase domain-containing protein [Saprospiraceae bacterium]
MSEAYDKYYQTDNLFGAPYPELLEFYSSLPSKGKLLDLGCGQGRDAIALAKLGFEVMGIDSSKVGIKQLSAVAEQQGLSLQGEVADIYTYTGFGNYDYILLDSMFHFRKRERAQEIALLERIFVQAKLHTIITICIQDTGDKIEILDTIIARLNKLEEIDRSHLRYTFIDSETGHRSETPYQMLSVKKGVA